jgi:hypothetical protein
MDRAALGWGTALVNATAISLLKYVVMIDKECKKVKFWKTTCARSALRRGSATVLILTKMI